MVNKKLEAKIGKIRKIAVNLIDLEKMLGMDIFVENDKIHKPVEEKCWELIKELNKITKEDGNND